MIENYRIPIHTYYSKFNSSYFTYSNLVFSDDLWWCKEKKEKEMEKWNLWT